MRSLDSVTNALVADDPMPAVRLRAGDVLVLAEHFLRKFALAHSKVIHEFTDSAREKIVQHESLRDVRELESAIEEAVVRCDGERIDAADLSFETNAFSHNNLQDLLPCIYLIDHRLRDSNGGISNDLAVLDPTSADMYTD